MEVSKVSPVNQSYLNKSVSQEITTQQAPKEVRNGKKKMVAALAGLGVLGTAALMIYKGRNKQANDIIDEANEVLTKQLSDIKFDKGIAKQGDELFSGVIEDTLKNGQKITLEYQNGIIQKATKDGIEKTFDHEATKKLVDETKKEIVKKEKVSKEYKKQEEIRQEIAKRSNDEITLKEQQKLNQEKYNKIFDEKLSNKSAQESAEVFNVQENERLSKQEEEIKDLLRKGKKEEVWSIFDRNEIQNAQAKTQKNTPKAFEKYAQRLNTNKTMAERAYDLTDRQCQDFRWYLTHKDVNRPCSKALLDALGKLSKEKQAAISDVTLNELLGFNLDKRPLAAAQLKFKFLPEKLDMFTADELVKIQASEFGIENLCKYILNGSHRALVVLENLIKK